MIIKKLIKDVINDPWCRSAIHALLFVSMLLPVIYVLGSYLAFAAFYLSVTDVLGIVCYSLLMFAAPYHVGWSKGWGRGYKYIRKLMSGDDLEYIISPNNDLEWLAINVDRWESDGLGFITRNENDKGNACYVCSDYCTRKAYTQRQWKDARHKLGLE